MARKEGIDETARGESGGNGAPSVDAIEQVRELLFGEARRETSDNLRHLETQLAEMRADFLERLSALEARLADTAREGERAQAASIEAIGGAIAQLGATIQNMSARRKG